MKCCCVGKRLKLEFLSISAPLSMDFHAPSCVERAGLGGHLGHAVSITPVLFFFCHQSLPSFLKADEKDAFFSVLSLVCGRKFK